MERTLIEAWRKIEAQELLTEKNKLGKVTAVKKPAAKTTAVKGKKLDEDGVGGPAGAGVGSASNTAAKGDQIVKSGAAAVVPTKLGKKAGQVKEDANVKNQANRAAQQSVQKVQSGTASTSDAAVVGQMVSEAPDVPDQEIPDDVAADAGVEDPHADGPEAAADAELADPAAEEGAEEVSVDAETAEQVVAAIQAQYPGAVITISVQLPEETPFDTDLVAAAQEVVDGGAAGELAPEAGADDVAADLGDEVPAADAEIEGGEEAAPEELLEKRKVIIAKTRKQIKEMFARMEAEEDPAADPAAIAPEADPAAEPEVDAAADPAALDGAVEGEEPLAPEVEVGDTKIALSPEQWGQVLATTDLLNGGAEGDMDAEGGEELPVEEPPVDGDNGEAAAEDGEEEKIDELRTEVNLDSPSGKMEILKKIEKGDFAKKRDDRTDVAIKPAALRESKEFNAELAGYSEALKKMLGE